MDGRFQSHDAVISDVAEPKKFSTLKFVLKYLAKKIILIFATIFIGVFITIIIINRPAQVGIGVAQPQLDKAIREGIQRSINLYLSEHTYIYEMSEEGQQAFISDLRLQMEEEIGLNNPNIIKSLNYTFKALKFDWGRLNEGYIRPHSFFAYASRGTSFNLNEIILQHLSATLILVVTSYLFILVIGLPLALKISQHQNSWFDRLMSFLAPISSVPSWVIGLLLIYIFAVELKLLPVGGIFDTLPPENKIGYIPIVLKHMVLPVFAIILSLFFQLVYSWRTMFITFSEEDYVDLGVSMGLPPRKLRKNYILKPTLPYVITSFSLMLISFWQMTMALEVIFQWEGIGWLYITMGLPNFWGESMYPGSLIIALTLVVLFAYILGIVVFILDLVYIIVDPRIRILRNESILRSAHFNKVKNFKFDRDFFKTMFSKVYVQKEVSSEKPAYSQSQSYKRFKKNQFASGIKRFFIDIRKFPSAIIGMSLILLLLLGSIYAMVALPYNKIGGEWGKTTLTGKVQVPKLARPSWTNKFRYKDLLTRIIINSNDPEVTRNEIISQNGSKQITLTFTFDYDFAKIPSEMYLYLEGEYENKTPFVSLTWLTPDGRELKLKGMALGSSSSYDFGVNIPARRWVSQNENWQNWFNFTRVFPTPYHYLLFASPDSTEEPIVVNGTYQMIINGITFEKDSDIQAELVLLGQVYGAAGTDYLRRDLVVPLLWGMPFALIIGLVGSVITTILSMIIAATGVWFGGWVDNLVQRLTEINLVLPVLAICVLAYAFLGINIWVVLFIVVLLNVFGSPTKNFRSAFLQIKDAPYIESARSYGASDFRIILKYMVPKIIPILVPQLIILIPSFVFLEATLGLFNINTGLPTWGTVIYQAMTNGALYGSKYWVLEPLSLLLLTGVAFALFGSALERLLNPRLLDK
jgi:peptide/nickel transport system permease protein